MTGLLATLWQATRGRRRQDGENECAIWLGQETVHEMELGEKVLHWGSCLRGSWQICYMSGRQAHELGGSWRVNACYWVLIDC